MQIQYSRYKSFTFFSVYKYKSKKSGNLDLPMYSRGQKNLGQCFFANVNLLFLSMVTMKIFIYLF
jgi:hypothetical protein